MNKKTIIIGSVILLVVLIGGWIINSYNGLVVKDEKCTEQWSIVESQYQRRIDLIPNLVNTVKGYAEHEKEALQGVIEARSKATQTSIDPSNMTEENMAQFQASQEALSSSLSRLMMVVERYPDLKANQNFLELQSQLEGTENRIAQERRVFATVVKEFNTHIRRFPTNMIAGMFGFEKKAHFKAQEGAEKAPTVEF